MLWGISGPALPWLVPGCELSQKVPVSAQLLPTGRCFSVKYLTAWAGRSGNESYGSRAIRIFPSINKTDRSCLVKLDLCGKADLSVKEGGLWEPSAHPFVLGKFVTWRSRESLRDSSHVTSFFCHCPKANPGNAQ